MKAIGVIAALLLLVTTVGVDAAPYDGSKPMNCAIEAVMLCTSPSACVQGTAQTVMLPSTVVVDVPGGLLSGAATGRTIKIVSVGHGGGRLMLHGEELRIAATAWNVVVEESSGAMTAAVLSRISNYLVFGTCSPR